MCQAASTVDERTVLIPVNQSVKVSGEDGLARYANLLRLHGGLLTYRSC